MLQVRTDSAQFSPIRANLASCIATILAAAILISAPAKSENSTTAVASDVSGYITGQMIGVNGGTYMP